MPPRRPRTREEKDARNEREKARRRRPPHSKFINADVTQMAAYQQDREEHQAKQRRQAVQRALTLTSPYPTPHSIILANDLLGLPMGTSLPPNVHTALVQIDNKLCGLLQDMEKEGLLAMWDKFKAGNRTFLHIWRVGVHGELQGKSGSMDIFRRRQECWDKCYSTGQFLIREFGALTTDWQAPSTMLTWWSSFVERMVQFLQLMTLLLDKEILSFLTGGQWGRAPDDGVKRELMKKIESKGATFVRKWNNEEFTLQCLLPGKWLNGSMINFFVAKWQPAATEGVRICNGWFWTNRLENVVQQPKDAGLSKREREEKENVAWKKIFDFRFGVTTKEPGVRLGTHLTRFPASRFIIPIHIHNNHWIVSQIDIDNESLSIYDSWPATWERNNTIKDNKKTEHWPYIIALSKLTVRLMEIMGLKAPDFTNWTIEPHKKVPWQVNSCDCGVFALLFIYHLKCGGLNSDAVPLKYRFDMPGELEGLVGGDLDGARYALVEEALSEVTSEHVEEHVEDEEVIDLSD